MNQMRNWLLVSCLVVLGLVVAGCGLSTAVKEPLPPAEDLPPLLEDDFSGNEIGTEPEGWSISADTRTHASLKVVEAPELDTGYAVHFKTNVFTDPKAVTTNFNRVFSGPAVTQANTISVDFAMKWIEGGSININVYRGSSYAVNLYINADGTLGYRWTNAEKKSVDVNIVALDSDVWYRVRAVANLQTKRVDIYLDDMDEPILADQPFRHATHEWESWENVRLAFSHATHNPAGEAMYADVKVTAID